MAPGVEVFPTLTPTLPPATHTNSYALGGSEVLLVEPATPFEDERREWLAWAEGLASQGRRIVAIFATHHHSDHVGGAELLCRTLGLPLWTHALTAERIEAPVARCLEDGEVVRLDDQAWRCLHTPGHAPGHLCLHDEAQGTLVVGDMVASVGTIVIAPEDGDLKRYLSELERLRGLDARLGLPAHGDPIPEPTGLFAHYVKHRLGREAKVLDAVRRRMPDGGDLDDLVALAYDDTPPAIWPLAKLSLESHLLKLVAEGRVERRDGRYRAAAAGADAISS